MRPNIDRQIEYWAHMLDDTFRYEIPLYESGYTEFSGIDFQKSKPWTEAENKAAKNLFYRTDDPVPYGFILPDGTKLDFSKPVKGESGEIDHYSIMHAFSEERLDDLKKRAEATGRNVENWNDVYEEIKYEAVGAGLIRLYRSNYAYMVHIIQKPTDRQMDALYDIRDGIKDSGVTHVEFYGPESGLIEYESIEDFERRFMNDVRNSF